MKKTEKVLNKSELLNEIEKTRWDEIVKPIWSGQDWQARKALRLALEEAYACGLAMQRLLEVRE